MMVFFLLQNNPKTLERKLPLIAEVHKTDLDIWKFGTILEGNKPHL